MTMTTILPTGFEDGTMYAEPAKSRGFIARISASVALITLLRTSGLLLSVGKVLCVGTAFSLLALVYVSIVTIIGVIVFFGYMAPLMLL